MRLLPAVAILLAGQAMADEGPSFDCSRAASSAEEAICADPELARLDRLLADRFAQALAAARALDVGAAEAEADLKAYQRGWIGGRDECWKSDDLSACIADAYLDRDGALTAQWMLEPAGETVFWTCGGNPANEVVTTFFATERPSVRFERGDTVDTGALRRTASGARYEGSFGRSIWIKGDEAQYRDPDPDGTEWSCVKSN
ncbi:MAG: MliC family protein [Pseudomonadota bacterium]